MSRGYLRGRAVGTSLFSRRLRRIRVIIDEPSIRLPARPSAIFDGTIYSFMRRPVSFDGEAERAEDRR